MLSYEPLYCPERSWFARVAMESRSALSISPSTGSMAAQTEELVGRSYGIPSYNSNHTLYVLNGPHLRSIGGPFQIGRASRVRRPIGQSNWAWFGHLENQSGSPKAVEGIESGRLGSGALKGCAGVGLEFVACRVGLAVCGNCGTQKSPKVKLMWRSYPPT